VATPIAWEELKRDVRFDHFNAKTLSARLKRLKRNPWDAFFTVEQSVTKEILAQVGASVTSNGGGLPRRSGRWRRG